MVEMSHQYMHLDKQSLGCNKFFFKRFHQIDVNDVAILDREENSLNVVWKKLCGSEQKIIH